MEHLPGAILLRTPPVAATFATPASHASAEPAAQKVSLTIRSRCRLALRPQGVAHLAEQRMLPFSCVPARSPPPPAPPREGAAPGTPPPSASLPPAGPRVTFLLRRANGASLAALIQQVRAAVLQAALSSGATSPPLVSVTEVPISGRRRLAATHAASPATGLLVTVTFAPEDAAAAQQLGNTLLSQLQAVLPPGQFGSLEVQDLTLDGQPIAPPPPPGGSKGSREQTAVIAGAVGGGATIAVAGEQLQQPVPG